MLYNSDVHKAGIYIHVPFCERKCTYCNFNTTDFHERLAASYVDAVEKEILTFGQSLSSAAKPGHRAVDTIYFGGGTPSMVDPGYLARLVQACRDAFDVSAGAEITIEINPGSFSREKIDGWAAAGINRASVGVQSFIDRELEALSRTHTADGARRTIYSLREAGFDNISLDLIAGLPDQTLADWEFNLKAALELRPEHLSLYLLEVKEGTQLFAQLKRGLRPEPDDDLAAEMYESICEATRAAGYEQYEISNFAKLPNGAMKGRDDARLAASGSPLRSKHNMKYWTGAPFYGMGCGAHSYDERSRWSNVMKTESYINSIAETGQAIAERRELSDDDRCAEALFMGLRLREGIDLDQFQSDYSIDVTRRYHEELRRIVDAGLIQVRAGRLVLTDRGRLLSNEVFVAFV